MIPLWKGSANTWDCDELGHMNVRVYVEKSLEGIGAFSAAINMPHAFQANAPSTLLVAEQHIRFIREVFAAKPVSMVGCILEHDETSVLLYQEMRQGDGSPAAAFRTRLIHAETKSGRPFPWSQRSLTALDALKGTPPEETRPRGLSPDTQPLPDAEVNLEKVQKVGAMEIGRGLVPPTHCDLNGRMLPSWTIGRISDSVPNLLYGWRSKVADANNQSRIGGAVLEYRTIYRSWPRAGDRFVIHTGLNEIAEKTHQLVHWTLNADTGTPFATSAALAVSLDLDARKIIPTPADLMDELKAIAPIGMTI
ncbi:MAG: thioesterase family protein [Pseudomonadota bacterium]